MNKCQKWLRFLPPALAEKPTMNLLGQQRSCHYGTCPGITFREITFKYSL